jgi:ferric-dicitrate binding protein FerR (iron transport regulator)
MSVPCEEIRPELEALLGAMTEGALEAEGRRRLATILREHPDARQFYLEYCQMHALLKSAHGELQALEVPSDARRRRLGWVAAAAAVLLLAGGLPLFWRIQAAAVNASVASVQGSAWIARGEERVPLADARRLRGGDRVVTVADGRAEVHYDDGSKLLFFDRADARFRGHARVELKEGAVHCEVTHQPAGRSLVFTTPQAEATILGTTFDLSASWNETRLSTLSGQVRLEAEGRSVEIGPGEVGVANSAGLVRWKPICDLDFSKRQALPPQMETVFCPSRTLHTPERKIVPSPDRTHFRDGGLVLGSVPSTQVEHGLIVARWKEDVGEDVVLEADIVGGRRWSLGFSLSGDSFDGYRVIFAVFGYPEGITIDTIHPVATVVLASDPRPITYEKDHLLRVEKRGKRVRIWVDRELRMDTEITHPLPEGRLRTFGISNFGAPPVIRSFRAWKATAP